MRRGQPMQPHSDAAYAGNPLPGLLPEAGPRGAGRGIRLHAVSPDLAARERGFDNPPPP